MSSLLEASHRPQVLYIDDDAALCRLVSKGLGRRGYAVTVAHDGASGLDLAAQDRFDAIAIDHYMPGQTGLATLSQLRAVPGEPPIVYVTASDEIRIAIAALKAGAADYVIKSGSEDFPTLLANALDQVLAQVSLRREKEAAEAALRSANERLEAVVHRQAVLLREVNHRVANSLQLVASLVQMQAGAVTDEAARQALTDTQTRINAVMQVHRRLYTSDDVQYVDMAEYLQGLVDDLGRSTLAAGGGRRIALVAEPVRLQTDRAVSVGVVVNELVANALKYAYPDAEGGEVRILFGPVEAGRLRLVVEDDGRGMGEDDERARGTGLGRKVVAAMAHSLESRIDFDPAHAGVRAVLVFAADPAPVQTLP